MLASYAPPSTYARALGENLLELWIAGSGMTISSNAVQSWRGCLRGLTFQAVTTARAPSYATDGSYFGGRPVVQFSKQVSPPTGFGQLNVPALGVGSDVGMLFVVGRMRVDTIIPTAEGDPFGDFECLMEAYASGSGVERSLNLNFNEAEESHGYISEVFTAPGISPDPSFHLFPMVDNQTAYMTPQLIWGTNGYGAVDSMCGINQQSASSVAAPYALGQANWLSLGLEPRIDRGCNFNLCAAGWLRNPMTDAQRYALMVLLANEWGTPLPT